MEGILWLGYLQTLGGSRDFTDDWVGGEQYFQIRSDRHADLFLWR